MVRRMQRFLLPALLLGLAAAPAVAGPRLSGDLSFGIGSLPDGAGGASRLTAVAGGRIALGFEVATDSGPRLDFAVEFDVPGPSGLRLPPRRD